LDFEWFAGARVSGDLTVLADESDNLVPEAGAFVAPCTAGQEAQAVSQIADFQPGGVRACNTLQTGS
jgi:hypothetical protein